MPRPPTRRAFGRFFRAMLAEGVAMAPGAYEAIFVGLGHTDDVLDRIGVAAERAAVAAAVTSDADAAAPPRAVAHSVPLQP